MKVFKVSVNFMYVFLISLLLVFTAGLYETIRIQSFEIVEDNVWGNYTYNCDNPLQPISECTNFNTSSKSNAYLSYEEFVSQSVFTNEPMISIINYGILIGLFYWLVSIIRMVRNSNDYMSFTEVFTGFQIFMIFSMYFFILIIDWLKNILIDQLIMILFNDIYSNIYMIIILENKAPFFLLFGYFVLWASNEIKNFNEIRR